MKTLDDIIDGIIEVEGGYTDHPDDKGGPTCWGITEIVAKAYGYNGHMKNIPVALARRIYWARYITDPNFDKVFELSPIIGLEVIDTGVNMGVKTSANFLQQCLSVLNRQGKDYQDVPVDGVIGVSTLTALRRYLEVRGKEGEAVLLKALNCLQGARYILIAEKNQTQESFVYGWIRARVAVE